VAVARYAQVVSVRRRVKAAQALFAVCSDIHGSREPAFARELPSCRRRGCAASPSTAWREKEGAYATRQQGKMPFAAPQ